MDHPNLRRHCHHLHVDWTPNEPRKMESQWLEIYLSPKHLVGTYTLFNILNTHIVCTYTIVYIYWYSTFSRQYWTDRYSNNYTHLDTHTFTVHFTILNSGTVTVTFLLGNTLNFYKVKCKNLNVPFIVNCYLLNISPSFNADYNRKSPTVGHRQPISYKFN